MKRIDDKTIEQIHQLIDAYFDAQTTTEEETLLKQILANVDVSTPKIQEARAVLGLFAYKRKNNIGKKRFSFRFKRVLKYAALIAVCAVIGITVTNKIIESESTKNMAWIGGKVVTDEDVTLNLLNEQLQDIATANENTFDMVAENFNDVSQALK